VFESTNFVTSLCGDVWNAKYYIIIFGFGGSMLLAYCYTYAMRISIITKTVVWGSIWSVFFFTLALAGYAHYMVGVYKVVVNLVWGASRLFTIKLKHK
jgi:uncharacterized membrane protein YpjA